MRWRVFVRHAAEADIDTARRRYDSIRPGLGIEFLDEVTGAINELAESPELSAIYYRGFRRVLLRRFPYKLFYLIEEERIIVFRVLHGKQDHPRWLSR